jgi:hypothetical protein
LNFRGIDCKYYIKRHYQEASCGKPEQHFHNHHIAAFEKYLLQIIYPVQRSYVSASTLNSPLAQTGIPLSVIPSTTTRKEEDLSDVKNETYVFPLLSILISGSQKRVVR